MVQLFSVEENRATKFKARLLLGLSLDPTSGFCTKDWKAKTTFSEGISEYRIDVDHKYLKNEKDIWLCKEIDQRYHSFFVGISSRSSQWN